MWPRVLRFVAALFVAAVAWYNLTPAYDRFLAAAASPLIRIDRRFRDTRVFAAERLISVRPAAKGSDLPPADIPADQLTYNVILLAALFASNRKPVNDRNVFAFLRSAAIVVVLQVVAVLLSVESTYAVRMNEWSDAHYGTLARYFWLYAEIFYRLVGMFGVVFVCWWMGSATMKRS
jgi:hypothetical protein